MTLLFWPRVKWYPPVVESRQGYTYSNMVAAISEACMHKALCVFQIHVVHKIQHMIWFHRQFGPSVQLFGAWYKIQPIEYRKCHRKNDMSLYMFTSRWAADDHVGLFVSKSQITQNLAQIKTSAVPAYGDITEAGGEAGLFLCNQMRASCAICLWLLSSLLVLFFACLQTPIMFNSFGSLQEILQGSSIACGQVTQWPLTASPLCCSILILIAGDILLISGYSITVGHFNWPGTSPGFMLISVDSIFTELLSQKQQCQHVMVVSFMFFANIAATSCVCHLCQFKCPYSALYIVDRVNIWQKRNTGRDWTSSISSCCSALITF